MMPITKKVAIAYSIWCLLSLSIVIIGQLYSEHGEYAMSMQMWLSITGLPLSLFSWVIAPDGTVFGVFIAGIIGLLQWCIVTEIIARWRMRKSRT